MKTTYTVHIGPTYPPAFHVSPLVDFCLVATNGGLPEVLLALTVPARHKGGWRTRKLNQFKAELDSYAKKLNGQMTAKARAVLLNKLAVERARQQNVAALPSHPQSTGQKSFGAHFGNRVAA